MARFINHVLLEKLKPYLYPYLRSSSTNSANYNNSRQGGGKAWKGMYIRDVPSDNVPTSVNGNQPFGALDLSCPMRPQEEVSGQFDDCLLCRPRNRRTPQCGLCLINTLPWSIRRHNVFPMYCRALLHLVFPAPIVIRLDLRHHRFHGHSLLDKTKWPMWYRTSLIFVQY